MGGGVSKNRVLERLQKLAGCGRNFASPQQKPGLFEDSIITR